MPDDWRADLVSWPSDLREAWEERAAILEFDSGLGRDEAERLAWDMLREKKEADKNGER